MTKVVPYVHLPLEDLMVFRQELKKLLVRKNATVPASRRISIPGCQNLEATTTAFVSIGFSAANFSTGFCKFALSVNFSRGAFVGVVRVGTTMSRKGISSP